MAPLATNPLGISLHMGNNLQDCGNSASNWPVVGQVLFLLVEHTQSASALKAKRVDNKMGNHKKVIGNKSGNRNHKAGNRSHKADNRNNLDYNNPS